MLGAPLQSEFVNKPDKHGLIFGHIVWFTSIESSGNGGETFRKILWQGAGTGQMSGRQVQHLTRSNFESGG